MFQLQLFLAAMLMLLPRDQAHSTDSALPTNRVLVLALEKRDHTHCGKLQSAVNLLVCSTAFCVGPLTWSAQVSWMQTPQPDSGSCATIALVDLMDAIAESG